MVTNCWYLLNSKTYSPHQANTSTFLENSLFPKCVLYFPGNHCRTQEDFESEHNKILFSSQKNPSIPPLPHLPTDPKCWQVSRKYAIIIIGSVLKLAHPYPSQLSYCFSNSSSTLPISLFHLFLPFCLPLHPISYSSLSHQTLYSYYTFSLPSEVLTLQVPIQLLTRVDSVLFPSWTSSS
jgi:hypothetical protein